MDGDAEVIFQISDDDLFVVETSMKMDTSELCINIGNLRAENHELRRQLTRLEWLLANANESIQRLERELTGEQDAPEQT